MRRFLVPVLLATSLLVAAGPPASGRTSPFRSVIELPVGFRPEGISSGRGTTFYVGSIPTGAVLVGDFRTGRVDPLVPGGADRDAIGVEEAGGLLWVAGGMKGKAFVYDARTGDDVEVLTLTNGPTFVNDVVVTRTAAFFTDSVTQVLYRVDRATFEVTTLPLTGALGYVQGFNVNGIEATPDGKTLVLVQSNLGRLFLADPATGATRQIVLAGGESVPAGDGILLAGRTLYVVQNMLNQVAKIRLSPDLTTGTVVSRTGNAEFDVPTTIAGFGHRLYAVNARFTNQTPDDVTYSIVGFRRP